MEVVRKNFRETLPLVSESISKADFLAIDIEFTGLTNGRDGSIFDTPEEYYLCILKSSMEFLPIQFGLCAFQWVEKEKHYVMDAYNFYLFPQEKSGQNKVFLCQSSCLEFLASQGFDFNKLIKEGISYMTEATETRLRSNLKTKQETYSKERENILVPDDCKSFIEDTCKKVRKFIDEDKAEEMDLDKCNSFIRLLLHQELKNKFKEEVFVQSKIEDNQPKLKVVRIKSEDDIKLHEKQKKQREWDELEEAVGFSKVIRLISTSEKLVVGHNMLFDILHTVNHFYQQLTPDYASFKEMIHFMFPNLLDTKYMASLPPFKEKVNSSVLQNLLTTLSEDPFSLPKVEWRVGCGYSKDNVKLHEAGYDAYMTGLCFLGMQAHLSRMRGEEPAHFLSPQSAALKPFLNKLFLSKTAKQDSSYMNLVGPDPNPSRDHVFHITFPKEWQRNEINHLFSPYGPVTIYFIDDTSALVALTWKDQAQKVLRAVSQKSQIRLLTFNRYKTLLAGNSLKTGTVLSASLSPYTKMNATEPKAHQTLASNVSASHTAQSHKLPQKVSRERTNSITSPTTALPAKKRTSTGVLRIEEDEPPPKKVELVKANSDCEETKKKVVTVNGLKKSSEVSQKESKTKEKRKEKKKDMIIEKFDAEAPSTNCVSGFFKESDSWE